MKKSHVRCEMIKIIWYVQKMACYIKLTAVDITVSICSICFSFIITLFLQISLTFREISRSFTCFTYWNDNYILTSLISPLTFKLLFFHFLPLIVGATTLLLHHHSMWRMQWSLIFLYFLLFLHTSYKKTKQ